MIAACLVGMSSCSKQPAGPDYQTDPVQLNHEIISDELEIPWQMAFAPDGRIFITERNGFVRIVENNELAAEPWLDLRGSINTAEGVPVRNSGVTGIALDPDFDANRYVYVGYSYDAPNEEYDLNRLVRYIDNPESGRGEVDKVLLEEVKGLSMHNTGQIRFGPDGKLYWSVSERHVKELAQDLDDLSGAILRMNNDGSIPSDNPFPDSYIYAYGLRNAQGFDWHPDTQLMMATDHGPSGPQGCCYDEVNVIKPGKNYGWPVISGDEEASGMERPLIHSGVGDDRDKYTWAPSGATFIHNGPWRGSFLFAGLRSQSLWMLDIQEEGSDVKVLGLNRFLQGEFGRIRAVEQDMQGNIYILTSNLDQHDVPFDKDFLVRILVD